MELFEFQKENVRVVTERFNGRAIIADEMGLGKTAQAIELLKRYSERPALIVCPASLRLVWRDELIKWGAVKSEDELCIVSAGTDVLYGDIVIISYELAAKRIAELHLFGVDFAILDESHAIKNPRAKRSKALISLCRAAKRSILLTGTPILNRPKELFSQLCAVLPKEPKFFPFARRYCGAYRDRYGWNFDGATNLEELNERLRATCLVRHLKKDVLKDLPEKMRQKIPVESGGILHYEHLRAELASLLEACNGSEAEAAKKFFKQRVSEQVENSLMRAYSETGAGKVFDVIEQAEAILSENRPLIIYAHHKAVVKLLRHELEARKYRVRSITGETPSDARHEAIESFQRGELDCLVLSLMAANSGFTLTRASDMIFAELPWSPGILLQAEDRIHRIGQTTKPHYRYIVAEASIDDILWRVLERKLYIQRQGVGSDSFKSEAPIGQLQEVVMALLSELNSKQGRLNYDSQRA